LSEGKNLHFLPTTSFSIQSILYKKVSVHLCGSLEKKLLIDLFYKDKFYSKSLKVYLPDLFYLDKEGKILGYKCFFVNGLDSLTNSKGIAKTFLHSTLFGTIKLIKI
jgi:hypothetical protein